MDPDLRRRLVHAAESQHGILTRQQALALGASPDALTHLVRSDRWRRVLPETYVVHLGALSPWTRAAGAVAYLPGGALARLSAAAAHGWAAWPDTVHVVSTTRTRLRRRRLAVHHTSSLPPGDLCTVSGIAVTSPLRTVLDLGGRLPLLDLADVVALAVRRRQVDEAELRRRVAAGSPHDARLANLRRITALEGHADSGPELVLADALRGRGEDVVLNAEIVTPDGRRRRGDVVLRRRRTVVQVDSARWHSGLRAEDDMRRDADWAAAGWTVVRVSPRRIRQELDRVVAEVLGAASARGAGA